MLSSVVQTQQQQVFLAQSNQNARLNGSVAVIRLSGIENTASSSVERSSACAVAGVHSHMLRRVHIRDGGSATDAASATRENCVATFGGATISVTTTQGDEAKISSRSELCRTLSGCCNPFGFPAG